MADVDFGAAWSCVSDLVMPATLVSGNRVVAEAIARRWQTPRGGLVDDADYGYDLSEFVNSDLDTRTLSDIASQAGREAEKDERVDGCDCTAQLVGGVLIVSGKVTTAAGPFSLVASVSDVSLTLLQVTA